jgi:hypothetical protein
MCWRRGGLTITPEPEKWVIPRRKLGSRPQATSWMPVYAVSAAASHAMAACAVRQGNRQGSTAGAPQAPTTGDTIMQVQAKVLTGALALLLSSGAFAQGSG